MTKREQREGWFMGFGLIFVVGLVYFLAGVISWGGKNLLDAVGLILGWCAFGALSYVMWMSEDF